MRRAILVIGLTFATAGAGYVAGAGVGAPFRVGHNHGCHGAHTCPSDHHTYIWYDAAGTGWDCAEPGAKELGPADTTVIVNAGLTYYCRPAGVTTTTAAATTVAPATTAVATTVATGTQCGVERWVVKTLSDPSAASVNFNPISISVQALRALPPPGGLGLDTPRIPPYEFGTYTVQASIMGAVVEDDHDIHIVLADPTGVGTMIAEFPDVGCSGAASSVKRDQIAAARQAFVTSCGAPTSSYKQLHGTVAVTGVAFFDQIHGQTGVAPNGIELHPVIGFAAASCAQGPAPATTTAVTQTVPTTAPAPTTAATATLPTTSPAATTAATPTVTNTPTPPASVKPAAKAKIPKCKRGQKSTKKKPCRKR